MKRYQPLYESKEFIGYRVPSAYGKGHTDISTVLPYEIKRGTIQTSIDIDKLKKEGYTKVVWLMSTIDELKLYDPLQDEREWNPSNFEISKYTIKNPKIIHQSGIGTLVAYKPGTETIEDL